MTPTLTDPRQYRSPEKLQQFFERVMRSTAPTRPPFLHRLGFSRRTPKAAPTNDKKGPEIC